MANQNREQQLSILLIFVAVALLITFARSDTIIKSSDGEDVLCVDKMKQTAFDHPLLQEHKIQEQPSEIPTEIEPLQKSTGQIFEAHVSTANCPKGTVPLWQYYIREDNNDTINNKKYRMQPSSSSTYTDPGHEYAVVTTQSKIYGAKATINVWDPTVEIVDEMSISQIWISSGQDEDGDLNTIEVGWQINPMLYGDIKPRLFLYWTSDDYTSTGGYNLKDPGFVQTSSSVVVGGIISPISSLGGSQSEITIHVWKDTISGNWWLSLGPNNVLVGYWPNEIFTTLGESANRVDWGGEILNTKEFGRHTKTQMGSGHFPNEGFRNASYFRNLMIVDNNNNFRSVRGGLRRTISNHKYYSIKEQYTEEWKRHFFYGGPGFTGGSEATHLTSLALTSFCFLVSIFFII